MRALNTSEFGQWIGENNPASYIFSSENNSWLYKQSLNSLIRFDNADVSCVFNRIYFKCVSGSICLENVKEVLMYDDIQCIGVIFDVVCGENNKYIYRFIAD